MEPWKALKDLMRPLRTEFQDNMTDVKHDEWAFLVNGCSARHMRVGQQIQIFWEGNVIFYFGLPSVSKFLHDDLGGMIKISNKPLIWYKRGVLITDGSMKKLTLTKPSQNFVSLNH